MLQDALRALAPEGGAPGSRLDVAKRVMRTLPESAWLRANRNFADHVTGGDAGLYDLLLNPRDRAYDVPALAALLGGAGLAVAGWMEPMRYDPDTYLADPKLRGLAAGLDPVARAGLAENLCANISTHVVYCRRVSEPVVPADPFAADSVPIAREMPAGELAAAILPDGVLPMLFDGLRVPVPLPKLGAAILRLIDGVRSVGAIEAELVGRGVEVTTVRRAWREFWERMNAINRILLAPPAGLG
jgi:hypothetical protein